MLSNLGGFPGGSEVKASAWNVGDPGSIPRLGRSPGEENGNPLRYSCLENPHWQRNLAGYSPWGPKESGMTEWPSTAHRMTCIQHYEIIPSIFTVLKILCFFLLFTFSFLLFTFSSQYENIELMINAWKWPIKSLFHFISILHIF